MELTANILKYIDQSVLCWLATSSKDNIPNVSPKEVFTHYGNDEIIIANIASPQTVQNILENENVCISFIDVLVQKGCQIKGKAKILKNTDTEFPKREQILLRITKGAFPFASITQIKIETSKPILAPKYVLYPKTTEQEQIESAKNTYKLNNE
ncbi:pyridoxamine 5'-phosphate oxidase family protein [Wenyingzhuangia sp. IMCC45574]